MIHHKSFVEWEKQSQSDFKFNLFRKVDQFNFYSILNHKVNGWFILLFVNLIYLPKFIYLIAQNLSNFYLSDFIIHNSAESARNWQLIIFLFIPLFGSLFGLVFFSFLQINKKTKILGIHFLFLYVFYRNFIVLIFSVIPFGANVDKNFLLQLFAFIGLLIIIILAFCFYPEIIRSFFLIFLEKKEYCNFYQYRKLYVQTSVKINWIRTLVFVALCIGMMIVFWMASYTGRSLSRLITRLGPINQESINKTLTQSGNLTKAILILQIIIIAPLIEEIVFRQGLMEGKNLSWGNVFLSSFIFGLIHVHSGDHLANILSYAFSGFVLALIYFMFGNIWFTFAVHGINNILSVIAIFVLPNIFS